MRSLQCQPFPPGCRDPPGVREGGAPGYRPDQQPSVKRWGKYGGCGCVKYSLQQMFSAICHPCLTRLPALTDHPLSPTRSLRGDTKLCGFIREKDRIRTNFVRSIFGSTRGRVHESNSRHVVHPSTVLTVETQSRTVLGWCSSLRREPGRGSKRAICLLWVQRLA